MRLISWNTNARSKRVAEQIEYLDKVIAKASNGYMAVNFISRFFGVKTLTEEEIMEELKKRGLNCTSY